MKSNLFCQEIRFRELPVSDAQINDIKAVGSCQPSAQAKRTDHSFGMEKVLPLHVLSDFRNIYQMDNRFSDMPQRQCFGNDVYQRSSLKFSLNSWLFVRKDDVMINIIGGNR
jgi:hypothetical protein